MIDIKKIYRKIHSTRNNFSPLNAHVDALIQNEKQLSRLKRFRADKVLVKNISIFLLALGLFVILLAIAYWIYNSYPYSAITTTKPIYRTIEKPVYIDRPVIKKVEVEVPGPPLKIIEKPIYIDKPVYIKVPDPTLSQIIEKPIYIEKIIKVPIQITKREGVAQSFTFFNTKVVDKNGIDSVTVGARYESVNSLYPESQWCYARSRNKQTKNTSQQLDLAKKEGLGRVQYKTIIHQDAKVFGVGLEALKNAKKYCEFFPDKPPIESENSPNIKPFPGKPPVSGGKSGTGFYINSNGYLLTNHHVISGCSAVWVSNNERDIPAVVVKSNKSLDIAVIKANKNNTVFAKFSDNIRTGEDVMALGFPLTDKLGNDIKATKGNISALSGIKSNKNYLQFTAPIQSGNSGGPLLNEGGFVVGINTSKLVGQDYQNINFAINGNSAQAFLGKNSIKFEYSKYEKPLKSADLADKGKQFTVRVLCSN